MRIGVFVPGGVDESGVDRVIPALLALLERLASRHDVHVFALAQEAAPRAYALGQASIVNLALSGRATWSRSVPFFVRELRGRGPFDVLHAFWADRPGFLATLAARALRIPSVVSLGGGELAARPEIGYGGALHLRSRFLAAASLSLATTVTAASEPMARLAKAFGVTAERVPLGADPAWFRGATASRREPPFRLLQVAHLNRVKDQGTLLRAFRRALDTGPGLHLDLVGDDTLGGEIQRLATSLGLAPHVSFHGFLRHEETRRLFERADLLVVTSRHEAGPVAAVEAFAMGVPVVGTAVGHLAEGSGERCLAVPVGDDRALAEGILTLLGDPERRDRMTAAAGRWAREHDADDTARRFEQIYGRLTA